jgi:hypothetical protein
MRIFATTVFALWFGTTTALLISIMLALLL